MAPQKRKAEEDFYYTISDDENAPIEEETSTSTLQPPKKKSKQSSEDAEGLWGHNEADDGALDTDFVFFEGDAGLADEDFDGLETETSREKPSVDLDELIRQNLDKKRKKPRSAPVEQNGDEHVVAENIDLDDDEDGVLASDAFGMAVGSDVDEEEEREEDDKEPDEESEEDDAVSASSDQSDGDDDDDESSGEDEEELAKQRAFFAPEPKQKANNASSFKAMGLSRPILAGVTAAGFDNPTPIQAKTVPFALEGKDVVGQAVTGSGKTAAFLLPILERLFYGRTKVPTTRVVILTPTRELAMQCYTVAQKLAGSTGITLAQTVGGTSFKVGEETLRKRPDIVIATPGRFIDHMKNTLNFAVDCVEILVLDEADRMLQDGFADELNEIVTTLPKRRQTMLFSATMNSSVDELIRAGLNKPVRILADPQKKTVGTLIQEFIRLRPGREEKRMGYLIQLCKKVYTERVIIFFRQKQDIHRTRILFGLLGLSCVELHGSIKQAERTGSLESFRRGAVPFLLASDLASRGLDIRGVETVINYEAPKNVEDYIHRIGRTARAGRRGVAVTIVSEKDRKFVKSTAKSMKETTKLKSRSIDPTVADQWQEKVDGLEADVDEILEEEKKAKELAQVEMEVTRAENMINHHDEIMARPKRAWFEKEDPKVQGKKRDTTEKLRDKLKRRSNGNLSNKDRKKLDAHADRVKGLGGQKLKHHKGEVQKGQKGQKGQKAHRSKGKGRR